MMVPQLNGENQMLMKQFNQPQPQAAAPPLSETEMTSFLTPQMTENNYAESEK